MISGDSKKTAVDRERDKEEFSPLNGVLRHSSTTSSVCDELEYLFIDRVVLLLISLLDGLLK